MDKGYIKIYNDFPDATEALDDAEVGRLVRALFAYKSGQTPDLPGNEKFLFPVFRAQLDRDKESYLAQCQKNAENGKLGGRPKSEKNPKNPLGFSKSEKSQDKEKDKDKEEEKENTPHTPQKGDAEFEKFWSAYPKKVGKQAAKKAFIKAKMPVEPLLTAIERQKRSDQWSRDNGQYIPNPATWLNQGRWEDELSGGEQSVSNPERNSGSTWSLSAVDL